MPKVVTTQLLPHSAFCLRRGGYAGMRITGTGSVTFAPELPAGVTSLRLRSLALLGARVDVRYDASQVFVTLLSSPTAPASMVLQVCLIDCVCCCFFWGFFLFLFVFFLCI